jgi:predicted ATPase
MYQYRARAWYVPIETRMNSLFIEGVRAFKTRIAAPLGKLTLLVGENSTGKSTFLACTRMAWDIATRGDADFNEQPFELGTYNSIAHYHGGQGRRVKQFTIGAEFSSRQTPSAQQMLRGLHPSVNENGVLRCEGTFVSDHGSPVLLNWLATSGTRSVGAGIGEDGKTIFVIRDGDLTSTEKIELPPGMPMPVAVMMGFPTRKWKDPLWQMGRELRALERRVPRPNALAPVRSRPRRTYDPIRDRPNPEGEHVPALLSRLQARGGADWDALSKAIHRFGSESGLFSKVSVRSLGKEQEGEPFQIQVTLPGQKGPRNLLDVGYGVSQVLPILVESTVGRKNSLLLVQQPEVHLHPQAQAALGTFLARSAASGNVRYVIETHSDYLIDRVSMAIRDPRISIQADDVSLLFFENAKDGSRVHQLIFNERGDIVQPPPTYRRFFLDEQSRYLGIDN